MHVVRAGQPLGLEDAGELGERGALPEQHGVLADAPALELGEHGQRVGPLGDLVLARLESARGAPGQCEQHEPQRAADHPGFVEAAGDAGEALVGRDVDHPWPRLHGRRGGEDPEGLQGQEHGEQAGEHAEHSPQRAASLARWLGPSLDEPRSFHHGFVLF